MTQLVKVGKTNIIAGNFGIEKKLTKIKCAHVNSPLFTCFTVTVTENSGKTTLSSNFVFSELKIGVESRGIPIETRRVEMGCTPA